MKWLSTICLVAAVVIVFASADVCFSAELAEIHIDMTLSGFVIYPDDAIVVNWSGPGFSFSWPKTGGYKLGMSFFPLDMTTSDLAAFNEMIASGTHDVWNMEVVCDMVDWGSSWDWIYIDEEQLEKLVDANSVDLCGYTVTNVNMMLSWFERDMTGYPNPPELWTYLSFEFTIYGFKSGTGQYGGGSGTEADPYQIWTAEQMNEVGFCEEDWDKHFRLMADIDLSAYTGTSFNIIGNDTNRFTGVFDGNGRTISNLTYISNNSYIGMFGCVGVSGQIKDLGLIDINVDAVVSEYVGGLAGRNYGTITNCYASGSVAGHDAIGGLCGENDHGTISNCYATSSVTGTGSTWRGNGGLCGRNMGGTISNCYAKGSVTGGDGSSDLGGLCGWNDGTISNCYATGLVTAGVDSEYLGGLCGRNIGLCHHSYWDMESSGITTSAGGVGKTTAEMMDINTYIGWGDDIWTIDSGNDYPHLIWENQLGIPIVDSPRTYSGGTGIVDDPYLIGEPDNLITLGIYSADWEKHFKLSDNIDMSSFVFNTRLIPIFSGVFDGDGYTISNLRIDTLGTDEFYLGLFGSVSGEQAHVKNLSLINVSVRGGLVQHCRNFGGLCGQNFYGTISNCYTEGSITGDDQLGGLCGENYCGTISNCFTTVSVTGVKYSFRLGGLCGQNSYGTISNCYSVSSISGGCYFGGLCGGNENGTISNSYSKCSVIGASDAFGVGGLCGYNNEGTISNCYATGWVTCGDRGDYLGGLCGYNKSGTISKCYATCEVTGEYLYLGGLCGWNGGTISQCYATGSVYGGESSERLGGLCGYNNGGTISNCYAAGSISGNSYLGGLCGENNDGTIINAFWDVGTSGMSIGYNLDPENPGTVIDVLGKTTSEMQTASTFTDAGWDFVGESTNATNDFWRMCADGIYYPHLFYQYSVYGDFVCPDGVGIEDLLALSWNWLNSEEMDPEFSYLCDPTFDGLTNLADYAVLSENWLRGFPPPLAHWRLDGDYTDSIGIYDGTPVGDPNLVTDDVKVGTGAVELDGDDMVKMIGCKGIPYSLPRTCTAWVKTTTAPGNIIWWGKNDVPGGMWDMKIGTNSFLRVRVDGGYVCGNTPINTGQWIHVAAVLPPGSTSTEDILLYVNGELEEGTTSMAYDVDTVIGANLRIGADNSGNYLTGLLDDVRVYARPLSADEIAELAN
jgi:hypothetical protein